MTNKNYQIKNYYDCPACGFTWTELCDKKTSEQCPNCDKELVVPYKLIANMLDWTDHYTLTPNHITPDNNDLFETYGEDFDYVKDYDQNYVWTVVDDDEGELSIGKGMHFVNRIYYIISKESHKNDDENYHW